MVTVSCKGAKTPREDAKCRRVELFNPTLFFLCVTSVFAGNFFDTLKAI
jgi:hypothetical protein